MILRTEKKIRNSWKIVILYQKLSSVFSWKYNNTSNTISFSVSKTSFIFLMTPIDSTNDQNICVELFKATFTH